MTKKRLLLTCSAVLMVLAGCVRTPTLTSGTPEPTRSNSGSPTATPMYLSPLYKLMMFVGGNGWASNLDQSAFYSTINFGEHWLIVTPEGLSKQNSGAGVFTSFPSSEIGWICKSDSEASATLYSTIDAGRNWEVFNLNFACGQMSFINAEEGYILSDLGVGAGSQYVSLYHTADGGQSWDLRFSHDPADPEDHGLPTGGIKSYFGFLSSDIGLVAGSEPVPGLVYLYRTTNGGVSWKSSECTGLPIDENQETSVDNIIRINPTSAVLPIRSYLADGNSVTYFCNSTDAGENWNYVGMLENVEFLDFGTLSTGVAYGQEKMFQTEDGGATWTETTTGLPPAVTPVSVDMVNNLFGFLTATITPNTLTDNRIYMTGNNGKDWQPMPGNIIGQTATSATP